MTPTQATIDDLYRVRHQAELVGGQIVNLWPTEPLAGDVAGEILVSRGMRKLLVTAVPSAAMPRSLSACHTDSRFARTLHITSARAPG